VVNRVNHGFARTPCQVIYQAIKVRDEETDEFRKVCQFSWTCMSDVKPPPVNSARYQQAERIAYDVLVKDAYRDVVSGGTLFFHSVSVAPDWTYRQVQRIGNHIFYARGNQKG
jgi:spore germination cell wall hydrolase CwlJ-like protein